jgi:hypothetical protein
MREIRRGTDPKLIKDIKSILFELNLVHSGGDSTRTEMIAYS